jgi:hypothetical protein
MDRLKAKEVCRALLDLRRAVDGTGWGQYQFATAAK